MCIRLAQLVACWQAALASTNRICENQNVNHISSAGLGLSSADVKTKRLSKNSIFAGMQKNSPKTVRPCLKKTDFTTSLYCECICIAQCSLHCVLWMYTHWILYCECMTIVFCIVNVYLLHFVLWVYCIVYDFVLWVYVYCILYCEWAEVCRACNGALRVTVAIQIHREDSGQDFYVQLYCICLEFWKMFHWALLYLLRILMNILLSSNVFAYDFLDAFKPL